MKIDVHAHIASSSLIVQGGYELECKGQDSYVIHTDRYNVPVTGEMFSVSRQIEAMDRQGVDVRVLCNAPFLMGNEKTGGGAADWSRRSNEFVAECCASNPKRFMGFCSLPLDAVDAAISELHYAVNALGLAGVEFPTNFNGKNPDEEYFAPLFSEMDRLKLPLLLHPTCVRSAEALKVGYLTNLLGNPFETATAAGRMLVTGFFKKYPNVRVQLSHGGGALPYQLGRIGHKHSECVGPDGSFEIPDNLYFDTVVFEDDAMQFLSKRCKNVVLGTDAPFDMSEEDPVGFVSRNVSDERATAILESIPAEYLGITNRVV